MQEEEVGREIKGKRRKKKKQKQKGDATSKKNEESGLDFLFLSFE